MKKYPMIDFCRVICALLVVVLHCLEFPWGHHFSNAVVTCFSNQAVPFFFIVSGFFFAFKLYNSENKIKVILQYTKKQLLLYFAWIVLWLPDIIHMYLENYAGESFIKIAFILFRRILLAGNGVYWYILALAESVLIAGILVVYKKERVLYALAVIGIVLDILYTMDLNVPVISQINDAFYFVFSWSNNFVMKGLPYVAIGVFFSKNLEKIKINRKVITGCYVFISLLSLVLFSWLYNINFDLKRFVVFYPIQAVLLFVFAATSKTTCFSDSLCIRFREISASMYYLHTVFIYGILDVIWGINSPMLFRFVFTVVLSLLAYVVAKGIRLKPVSWLLSIKNGK